MQHCAHRVDVAQLFNRQHLRVRVSVNVISVTCLHTVYPLTRQGSHARLFDTCIVGQNTTGSTLSLSGVSSTTECTPLTTWQRMPKYLYLDTSPQAFGNIKYGPAIHHLQRPR